MNIQLHHPVSGIKKNDVKIGYSWTTLFLGAFVPLYRGDKIWTIIAFLCTGFVTGIATAISILPMGPFEELSIFPIFTVVFQIVFSCIYNRIYIVDLLAGGYLPSDEQSKAHLVAWGLINK